MLSFDRDSILLVNAIGSLPGQEVRFKVHQQFKQLGYSFMTIVSPKAIVSDYAILSEGVQVMPGTIVNVNAYIGEGTILNTGSIIEHDCVIGKHNHIAPVSCVKRCCEYRRLCAYSNRCESYSRNSDW